MNNPVQVKTTLETRMHWNCPDCGKTGDSVVLAIHGEDGPDKVQDDVIAIKNWTCDNCGSIFRGEVNRHHPGEIQLFRLPGLGPRSVPVLVLLKYTPIGGSEYLEPKEQQMYLVVRAHTRLEPREVLPGTTWRDEFDEFYYDENTCPTNYTRSVVAAFRNTETLIEGQNDDPHGIFKYIKTAVMPENFDSCDLENQGTLIEYYEQLFGCRLNGTETPL